MHQRARLPSELSLLEAYGHEFHIDAHPRGNSAKNIHRHGPLSVCSE